MSFINTWGYTLEEENIFPDDRALYNIGATVKCIAEDNDYVTCILDSKTIRILKSGYNTRKAPDFDWSNSVKIKAKDIVAQVDLICWHYNEERYFYHLKSDGKKLKKRYYADELELVK